MSTAQNSSSITRSSEIPKDGLEGLKQNWRPDLLSGFLVFLIALPLCLGISMASGFPPVAGILTAIIGGMACCFLGSAPLTIKGPAAGLIVIALGAVQELGGGDPMLGYKRALAVGVVAAIIQIIFGLARAGKLGDFFPLSVIHGMLAAIGVIIISKQAHTLMGVTPSPGGPFHLLAEIPHSLMSMNPAIMLIGATGLLILFGLPMLPFQWTKRIPASMVVVAIAMALGAYFNLSQAHSYWFESHEYMLGPSFLVRLPGSLLDAITFPDFSAILTGASIKYILMFALVGSIESLLSTKAVDMLDPYQRRSELDKDLLAAGIGNLCCALIGGLPMISEIVRSSANINNGAKTRFANFFHGMFLLLFVALVPGMLQRIPLAALAAMLVYTGFRLASPKELVKTGKIGREQLAIFVFTLVVTLATDLLVGVAAGIVFKLLLHLKNGMPLRAIFRPDIEEMCQDSTAVLVIRHAAVFSNYLAIKRRLSQLAASGSPITTIIIELGQADLVDHTVMDKLTHLQDEYARNGRALIVRGLHDHQPLSAHDLAARRRPKGSNGVGEVRA